MFLFIWKLVFDYLYENVEYKNVTNQNVNNFYSIDRFQSRDHFTIGRHIGTHVNSELVSREL